MATSTASLHRLPPWQRPTTPSQQLYAFRLPFTSRLHFSRRHQSISCNSSGGSDRNVDADLSSALSIQARKLKAMAVEREEAMKKSRQLLFSELCGFAGISPMDMKMRWTNKMQEVDKFLLLTEFVSEWGTNFHPLSARSVREMIEQHLASEEEEEDLQQLHSSGHAHAPFSSSSSHFRSRLFSGWRNLLNGF